MNSLRILRINKYFLSSVFLFLIFLPFSLAEQPFISESSEDITNAFSVVIPSEQTYKQGSEINLIASVFNVNGSLLSPDDSVSCRIQFLDENNNLLINEEMGFSNDQYNITIGSSITSEQRRHEYLIFCNTSTQGGFRTGEISITESGLPKDIEQVLFIILIVIAMLLFVFALNFQDHNLAFASGMIFAIVGIYLFRFGYIGINNFLSDSMAIILMGIGSYILFRTSVEYLNEAGK